jgi:hypothetical protein
VIGIKSLKRGVKFGFDLMPGWTSYSVLYRLIFLIRSSMVSRKCFMMYHFEDPVQLVNLEELRATMGSTHKERVAGIFWFDI